jgi:glycosyltransferase involved in cell wall biosynthesis
MRIALIGPSYPFRGGISHHTTLLYRYLKRDHEVMFFSFARQYPKYLFPGKTDIDPSDVHIQEPEVERIFDSINPISWLKIAWKIIRSERELLVLPWWVWFWTPQFWVISFLVKIFGNAKILFICHNVVEHESNFFKNLLTRIVLRNGDCFIVHSEEEKNNILRMFPGAKVRKVLHPTYDVFHSRNIDDNHIRKSLGIDGNIILFFGFIRPYKGLKYLISALPEVLQKEDVTLLVAGEFLEDKEVYLRLIESLRLDNRVIIVDEYIANEEVPGYFTAADLVVQPYVSATGSGVIQIAFAFNKPVVATRVGSLPEVLENGNTGYIVPPESANDLAKAIIRFFEEKKSKEFSMNIERVKNKFSWHNMVNNIEELVIGVNS